MVKKRVTAREKVRSKKAKDEDIKDGKSAVASTDNKSESAGEQLEFLLDRVGNSGREKRHLVKQMKFLKKLQATQEALAAKKQITKKKKKRRGLDGHSSLRDLSSLGEFLPTFGDLSGDSGARKAKVMRSAALQQITETETKQLAAVLHHPSFKQDPFAAIHQHLQNTLPPRPPTADGKSSKKSSKKKATKKKHGGGNQGMDTN